MKPDTKYTKLIEFCLKGASKIANINFGRVSSISTKKTDNNQVLTETDLEIGKYLIKQILNSFPEHNIIDEEVGVINNNSEYTWVLDPIDGTSNFAEGVPLFGVIIGLLYKGKPFAGGIVLPFFEEIALAQKSKGSFCNNKKLMVTKEKKLLSTLVSYAIDGHQEKPSITYGECKTLADIVLGIRNLRVAGSVFDAIMVAKGKYGGYLNRTCKIWDCVGQQVVVEEAGGVFTDFFGKPMDYSDPLSKAGQNFTWCIAAPEIHKQLQQIIHKSRDN